MKQIFKTTSAGLMLAATFAMMPAANAGDAATLEKGMQLFKSGAVPACAVCHTLQSAGAEGAIGPDLDELKPDQQRVAKAIKTGIGQMPAFTTLSDDDITAIARYVAHATGGAK